MADYADLLGVGATWVPTLIGLIGLPLLYVRLATDTHLEYAELIKESREHLNDSEVRDLVDHIDMKTQIFNMDWWVVGAIGALIFGIINLGNLQLLCAPGGDSVAVTLRKEMKVVDGAGSAPTIIKNLQPGPPPTVSKGDRRPAWGLCSGSFKNDSLKVSMSLYAALFAILVGFRLIWARLVLARELKSYYAGGFKVRV